MDEPLKSKAGGGPGPLDISEWDVLAAMEEIGGYIVTAGDFREICRVAQRTA